MRGEHAQPKPGEIHLWGADLARLSREELDRSRLLSVEECERSDRLVMPEARRHFVVAHVLLREVLARYLRVAPHSLTFGAGAHGKPHLTGAASRSGLCFNVAHSAERWLVAVTTGIPVGVDVEVSRPLSDALSIARRYFAPAEHERLAALPSNQRERAFLICWTRKEAVLKAHGGGMALGLVDVVTGFAPIRAPGRAVRLAGETFYVRDLTGSGYVGAVASQCPIAAMVHRTLD